MTTEHSPALSELPDLASARIGGKVLAANDEFFAPKENLVKPGRAVFIEGKYTSRGKWMDGWETRRRREPGFDWCVVRLGLRGVVRGVNVDTSHFLGNYPEQCSIEACDGGKGPWVEILPKSPLKGGGDNLFGVQSAQPWTHLRLNIYPDGGVARLRVFGDAVFDPAELAKSKGEVDLAAATSGGWVVSSSNKFFGAPSNMLMPGRAKNMGDGWETKRRRGPGYDWAIVRLGIPGTVGRIEVDTNHFKGNYPDRFSLEGSVAMDAWSEMIPETKLKPHKRHLFGSEIKNRGPFGFLRINIFPDGGISRLRVWGKPTVAPA